jgi:hypothetical protein
VESNAAKSRRRRRQITNREAANARLRKKYRTNARYRRAKIKAARRQTATRTTHQKGVLAERRVARRWKHRAKNDSKRRWFEANERQAEILLQELICPVYIIRRPPRPGELEQWPLEDAAARWIREHDPDAAAPPVPHENPATKPVPQSA